MAAEAALPGDLLYPVKLVVEPVRSLFDPDVAANHRVEELERLAVSDAPAGDINRAFDRAQRAVDDTASPELAQRVERVREQIRDSRSGGEDATDRATESAPSGDGPATTVTDSSPDAGTRSTTTTTDDDGRSGDRLQGSDGSGSTTTSPRQGSTSSSADRGGDGRTSAGG